MKPLSLLVFLLVTFNVEAGGKKRVVLPTPEPSPSVFPGLEPGVVLFAPASNYATRSEAVRIQQAGAYVTKMIQSACFAEFMTKRKLIQTNGRTPAQVVEHLRSLSGVVPVVIYYRSMRWTSAVAYRNPPERVINLNRAYFSLDLPVWEWASTMGHESVGHSLGEYGHDFKWSPSREFSVPYSINHAFEACHDKI